MPFRICLRAQLLLISLRNLADVFTFVKTRARIFIYLLSEFKSVFLLRGAFSLPQRRFTYEVLRVRVRKFIFKYKIDVCENPTEISNGSNVEDVFYYRQVSIKRR